MKHLASIQLFLVKRRTDCGTQTAAWRYNAASNYYNLYLSSFNALLGLRDRVYVDKYNYIVKNKDYYWLSNE